MRAVSRITLSPIVETLPCVGGVSITLLEAPYFDANFHLAGFLDILSLPIIHEAFHYAVKVRGPSTDAGFCHFWTIVLLIDGHITLARG